MSLRHALTLVCALACVAPVFAEESDPLLAGATQAFEAAQHRKVIEIAAEAPADAKEAARLQYLAGESRAVLGEWAEAEAAFRAVLAKRPNALPAQVGLGRALSQQDEHDEALEQLRAAVKADAKDASAARALGEALLRADKTAEGLKVLEALQKAQPADVATARVLVEAHLKAGKPEDARQVAQKAAKAAPKHPLAAFLQGLVLDREGKSKEAIEAYEKAIAADDTFLDAHKNLAILCHVDSNTYADQERVKKAFAHYERYFALGGADARLKQMVDTMKAYFAQAKESGN
jgi:tetratricopeptide (TPR) repeat protein